MASKKRQIKAEQKASSAQKKKSGKAGDKIDESYDDQSILREDEKSEDDVSVIGDEEDQQLNDIINKYGFRH